MDKVLNRIKYTRKRLGINQSELAELVGISPTMMSNYEANKTRLPSDIIPGICRELKISPNELFGWEK